MPADETELVSQVESARALLAGATAAGKTTDAIRAQSILARLSHDLQHRRAVREAGREKDPVRRLELMRDLAERDGSWVAARQYGAEARALREHLEGQADAEARKLHEAVTPEQRLARVREAAPRMDDAELEAVVEVWLARHGYALDVDSDGILQVRRTRRAQASG